LNLDEHFWNTRYAENETGWDLGAPSRPLKEYIDTLTDKHLRILIPGCGKAYEAEYLHQLGFKNVSVIDLAPLALDELSKRVPSFPKAHLIVGNFFEHDQTYDLILEQTFFCALDPNMRMDYATKMHGILKPNGKLAGVMFCFELTEQGPPFGGSAKEYEGYFSNLFTIERMEPCLNSIAPRLGRELWVELVRA
jgi:SAM-dependent methyltransferase